MVIGLDKLSKKELDRMKYGWSKYGKSNMGLVQNEKDEEWICQSCAQTQACDIPSFMFEFGLREFIRICPACQHKKLKHNITNFSDLIKHTRSST